MTTVFHEIAALAADGIEALAVAIMVASIAIGTTRWLWHIRMALKHFGPKSHRQLTLNMASSPLWIIHAQFQSAKDHVMYRSIARSVHVLWLAFILGIGWVANASAQQNDSGFLKDYSQLKIEKDPLGVERRIWASPKFTQANYTKVLLEPISFYPAPQASDKVAMATLNEIRDYMDSAMRKALASVDTLSDAPGPGVARIRVAITAAAVAGVKLKAYQYVPVALVATAAVEGSGKGSQRDVSLFVESQVTDSVTGEPLASIVRSAQGIQVKSNEPLTLQQAKPQIDAWAQSVREYFAARRKPDGK